MRRVSTGLIAGLVLAWVAFTTVVAIAQTPKQTTKQAPTPAAATHEHHGGSEEGKKLKNPVATTPQSIAAGQQIYMKQCSFCHGAGGKGDGTMAPEGSHPADLTDEKWEHGSTDGDLFVVIRDGIGPKYDMDGYKGKISDQNIWNVINYVRSIGPAKKP